MKRRGAILIALSFLGFASLGLPDGALGVAWPRMRESFSLPLDALGALLVAQTAGYVASSFLAGAWLARVSVGALLALSCAATGAALVGYGAAPAWALVIGLGVLVGLGAGAIDAGINAFAATSFPPRVLHLMHAAYGAGTTAGPALMTAVLMHGAAWRRGYWLLGAAQLALAVGFAATLRFWPGPRRASGGVASETAPLRETLGLRSAQLGAASFFLYLGVEATAGVWLYSLLEEGRGASLASAGAAVSAYWGSLLAGRLAFGFSPNSWRPESILPPAIIGCALAAAMLALVRGEGTTLAASALLGFSAAPIFPALIGSTPARVGPAHTANAVGLQVAAAALGQSALPALIGLLAAQLGLSLVPLAILTFSIALLAVNALLTSARPLRAHEETAQPTA